MTPLNLRPVSYVVLGMLRLGATSGYAVKKAADRSTANFWPVSLSQVYPELDRLERHGLVSRQDDPRGKRVRAAYELTAEGETAFLAWLRSPRETQPQLRSEGLLRLMFADDLSPDDQLSLVRRMRARSQQTREQLAGLNLPSTLGGFHQQGIRFPLVARHYGESLARHTETWMAELESQLEAESDAGPAPD